MARTTLVLLALMAIGGTIARAEEPAVSADEAAIRKNVQAAVEAFNRQDAKAMAALWSPDAVYTMRSSGTQVVGREAIEKDYNEVFEGKKNRKLSIDVASINFVSPNVAIERGTAKVTGGDEPAEETEYSA